MVDCYFPGKDKNLVSESANWRTNGKFGHQASRAGIYSEHEAQMCFSLPGVPKLFAKQKAMINSQFSIINEDVA